MYVNIEIHIAAATAAALSDCSVFSNTSIHFNMYDPFSNKSIVFNYVLKTACVQCPRLVFRLTKLLTDSIQKIRNRFICGFDIRFQNFINNNFLAMTSISMSAVPFCDCPVIFYFSMATHIDSDICGCALRVLRCFQDSNKDIIV